MTPDGSTDWDSEDIAGFESGIRATRILFVPSGADVLVVRTNDSGGAKVFKATASAANDEQTIELDGRLRHFYIANADLTLATPANVSVIITYL